jgi:hypothetical protein
MEYWEFLLQREGDRTWQPITSKTQIEAGRYRVVVHSSRTNTDVEICITHQSTEEVPPKRRAQKRSRRTNPEGLMVVIPYTYLRPGLWELRCCGDIMSDFLGLSWQHSIQIVVLPKVTEVVLSEPASPLLTPAQTESQTDLSENFPSTTDAEITVEPTPTEAGALEPSILVSSEVVERDRDVNVEEMSEEESAAALTASDMIERNPDVEVGEMSEENSAAALSISEVMERNPDVEVEETSEENSAAVLAAFDTSFEATPSIQEDLVQPDAIALQEEATELESETVEASQAIQPNLEIPTLDSNEAEAQPAPLADKVNSQEAVESDEEKNTLAVRSAEAVMPTNAILDQSLQMIEQILQQVLEPVMQEFEQSEPTEPEVTSTSEQYFESATNQPGLILTLDEESLVARRGELLTISGQVDVLDVPQLNGSETAGDWQTTFQGTLHYELRDPQNSRVLLDVELPLPEQALPLAFNHTLEIPLDCNTRLILGKVTLYDRRGRLSQNPAPVALASQPFMVTADLEELLGSIIPGTQAMPVAKVMVLANNLASVPDSPDDLPEASAPPIKQPVLDLVDVTRSSPPLSVKSSSGSPLPPQLYQPTAASKTRKSLQLPKLPKLRPITESAEPFVEQASLPLVAASSVVTFSEPEQVELKPEDSREQLQLPPADSAVVEPLEASDLAPATAESPPVDTPEDTALEPQLQEAMQQLEEAIVQIQSADSLSSATSTSQLSDSTAPLLESPDGTVSPEDNSADDSDSDNDSEALASLRALALLVEADRELFNAKSLLDAPETAESSHFTTESPIAPFEEPDAWESETTPPPASRDRSDATETQRQSDEFLFGVEPVTDSWSDAASPELAGVEERDEHPLESEPAGVDNAFQSLNVQNRFWSRLNSLATDTDLSQWLRSEPSFASNLAEDKEDENEQEATPPSEPNIRRVDVEEVTQPLTTNILLTDFDESMWAEERDDFDNEILDTDTEQLQPPFIEESTDSEEAVLDESSLVDIGEIDWAAQEFVVDEDDEEPTVLEQPEVKPEASHKVAQTEPPQPQTQLEPQPRVQLQQEILSQRQLARPIPAPELSIPTNELAAGEPVTIRVTLPPHPARLCVKLWVQDRQSRSLLDGPRWLMDLIPDRTGEQEALTQLTVPFGSVEIRFEAIAVDIDSQRESHKVSVDCVVVPPDLPDFSLDEFDP